jgi:ParB family chromosome partitioning protein
LALARVSPALIEKYRAGELTLELLQAFTVSDDHAAQERVWEQLPEYNRKPRVVRQMLSGDAIPASDKRVRFVGLAQYLEAGGGVLRDLFANDDN